MPGGRHPWGSPVGSDAEPWVAEKDLWVNGPVATHHCHRMVTTVPGEGVAGALHRCACAITDVRVQSTNVQRFARAVLVVRLEMRRRQGGWGPNTVRCVGGHLSQGVQALTVIDSG